MQHYVATRPMFIDVEVMNSDIRLVLGDHGSQPSPSNVARGLSALFKEITGLKVIDLDAILETCFYADSYILLLLMCRHRTQRSSDHYSCFPDSK